MFLCQNVRSDYEELHISQRNIGNWHHKIHELNDRPSTYRGQHGLDQQHITDSVPDCLVDQLAER